MSTKVSELLTESGDAVESLIDGAISDLLNHKISVTPVKVDKRGKEVGYIYSSNLLRLVITLPKVRGRALLVHTLITSYGLTRNMTVIESIPANETELRSFHTQDYIDSIKEISKKAEQVEMDTFDSDESLINEDIGIGYDCPAFPRMFETVSQIAGSSLTAAKAIVSGKCRVAVNWFGGWHHAHQDEASGYCYVNDIVIAILHLLQNGYQRILYLDLDLHHGDAVENAFAHTSKVMTVSFHKYEPSFFPGTGNVDEIGFGAKGKYYSVNVPLKDGIKDDKYCFIFDAILSQIETNFKPQIIICQMGADTLFGDPMNGFNLTLKGVGRCLDQVLKLQRPTILLGGGGYNIANTARLWAYLTSIALKIPLNNDIPEHCFFLAYKPSYELHIDEGTRKDLNSDEYVNKLLKMISHNLDNVK